MPVEQVRIISPFVGGAFGGAAITWSHQILAALTSRVLRRPVKLALTRRQMFHIIGYRAATRQRVRIGADTNGRISALEHEAHTETARYGFYEDNILEVPRFLYNSPNMRSALFTHAVDTNLPTYMRGPGEAQAGFALETALDELAHNLGLDPIELRRRNEPTYDQAGGLPFRAVGCSTATRKAPDCSAGHDGLASPAAGVRATCSSATAWLQPHTTTTFCRPRRSLSSPPTAKRWSPARRATWDPEPTQRRRRSQPTPSA
ncbi:MAG TPA: molybdopterin cofactor-binding domain-containing protein [Actinophytocola sp.]